MKDWDYDASDYLDLMTQFVERRLSVEEYRGRFWTMNKKRSLYSDHADVIIQRAFGDADDYDEVVHLPYTIDEAELRNRVADSVKKLKALLESESKK
jgi:self-protective colicin-like immunity protein